MALNLEFQTGWGFLAAQTLGWYGHLTFCPR